MRRDERLSFDEAVAFFERMAAEHEALFREWKKLTNSRALRALTSKGPTHE